jgi:tetratricopeptide (TPR) repeat protein
MTSRLPPSLAAAAARLRSLALFGLLALASAIPAQDAAPPPNYEEMDLAELNEAIVELMEASNWEEALKALDVTIKEFGPDALEDYGPMFGVMHYRRGFCLKNLRRFDEALAAYEECYNTYANKGDTPAGKRNPVWNLARLEMGIIKQATGRFEEAVADYEAFASNPGEPGTYDDTAFRIMAAAAYNKAGKSERGRQLIEQLFEKTGAGAPRPDALMRALLTLLDDCVSAESAEGADDGHRYLDRLAGKVSVTPFDMHRFEFNQRLAAMAKKAADGGYHTLTIRLISLMATSAAVVEDLDQRARNLLPGVSEALEAERTAARERAADPDSLDWVAQLLLAASYERSGNQAGALAVFLRCLRDLPEKSKHREVVLFGAMRTALGMKHMEFALALGTEFRKEFPQSQFAPIVNAIQLESLFFSRQYDKALSLAERLRDTLDEKSEDRDLADFVVGASLFNLDRPREAQPELAKHAETFPESRFKEHVRFFAASCAMRMREFDNAAELFAAFVKDFPNSEYLGFALMEQGTAHFQTGKFPEALEVLGELQKQLPDFPNLPEVVAMRGDAHLMLDNTEQAEGAYQKARELALASPNAAEKGLTVARILVQLVRVSKALNKNDEILAYYDEYMSSHKGGFYDPDMIISSIASLKEAMRGQEALDALQEVIIRLGSGEGEHGIEAAIGSYTEHFIEVNGPEPLLEKLLAFVPEGTAVNNTLKAWLIMARIDLLQNDEFKDRFPRRAAQIQVAFEELREFNKAELATYILVQVGRNLAGQGNAESDALAVQWFDAVMERGDSDHYPLALMGKARILADGGDGSAFKDAEDAFDKVIRELKDKPEYVEEAMLGKARLYFGKQMWKEAALVLYDMQNTPAFTRFRPEVFLKLGRAYEEQGKFQDALDAYTPFVGPPFENYVDYSAEARVRATQIVMKQGDAQRAFRLARDTVSRMHRFANHPVAGPHILQARELYKKLKAQTQAPDHPDEGIWGVR